ncbi:MAG: ABC transporter permease [Paludibacteraceae bacterium]|nr:ABC transporter permease [Paludibacteraceae bacterium]
MKLQLFIALRYLFSKKTHNIINLISTICAGGVCIATIALVCTLSVYNGFQQLISGIFNVFDPDLKISLVDGKTFSPETSELQTVKTLNFIEHYCPVLEDNALIRNKERQTSTTIKGVAPNYVLMISSDSIMMEGEFVVEQEGTAYAVIGGALADQIESSSQFIRPISLYAPIHNSNVNLANPEKSFHIQHYYLSGIYATGQIEVDSKYTFLPLASAQELFGYDDDVTSIELKLKKGTDVKKAEKEIADLVGERFNVQNKEEQHEDFYKMMKVEKWITFLILIFILLIAVFNVIGSLTMLIIEKEKDIITLHNLGATEKMIQQIFLLEGWLISIVGAVAGLIIGVTLCLLQQYFGFIKLSDSANENAFIVNAYPVQVEMPDILLILATILLIGLLVAWFPTRYINSKNRGQ